MKNKHKIPYDFTQICANSPWCEDDKCQCTAWEEYQSNIKTYRKTGTLKEITIGASVAIIIILLIYLLT